MATGRPPLLGKAGARKARADEANARLRWHSSAKGYLTILKNGHVVAQVPAAAGQWTDPDGMDTVNDYVLVLDATPVAVRNRPAGQPYNIEEVAY